MLTVPDPNTNETNKRFIRVSANTVWRSQGRKDFLTSLVFELYYVKL